MLKDFGEEFVRMTEQVFKTQAEGLKRMPWAQKRKRKEEDISKLEREGTPADGDS